MADPKQTVAPKGANKRGAARLAAVQALYQMDVAGSGLLEITAEYEAFRLGKELDGATYREADEFDVLLIAHSLAVTTWGERDEGDQVNIEIDTMARYAARLSEAVEQGL